jgi:murein DD-endopeptidase MepM/ murein hydrolase activator NlpD
MRPPLDIIGISTGKQNHFGAVRKYDIHTGIDLFAKIGTPVYAIEDGVVNNIIQFTGARAGSKWWNPTRAVLIQGKSGVFLYGEIKPTRGLAKGDKVKEGTEIGTVMQVLRKNKGLPTSMLHLELYTGGTTDAVWWKHNEPKPVNLKDPTVYVLMWLSIALDHEGNVNAKWACSN